MEVLKRWVPLTYGAFCAYRLEGSHLSSKGMEVIRRMLAGQAVTQPESGMSKREWGELMDLLHPEKGETGMAEGAAKLG